MTRRADVTELNNVAFAVYNTWKKNDFVPEYICSWIYNKRTLILLFDHLFLDSLVVLSVLSRHGHKSCGATDLLHMRHNAHGGLIFFKKSEEYQAAMRVMPHV